MVDSTTHAERRKLDHSNNFAKAVEQAETHLANDRPKEAMNVLERAGDELPVEALILLAQARYELFDNTGAAEALKQARTKEHFDTFWRAHLLLGELACEAGDFDAAKKHLQRSSSMSHNDARATARQNALRDKLNTSPTKISGTTPVSTSSVTQKETPAKMFITWAAALVGGAALLGGYQFWVQRSYELKKLVVEATPSATAGDFVHLRNAEQKYLAALALKGSDPHALSGLAEVYALLWVNHGDANAKQKATEYTQRAADKGIEKAEFFAAQGLVAYGEGRYQEGEAQLKKLVDQGIVADKVLYARGLNQRALGEFKAGTDSLRRAQSLKANAPHYATSLGDALDDDGNVRDAAMYWSAAAKTNPEYVPGVARALLARLHNGEMTSVITAELNKLEQMGDAQLGAYDKAAILLTRAEINAREGNNDTAMTAITQAIELGGPSARALESRARVALSQGNTDAALADLKTATQTSHAAWHYLSAYAAGLAANGQTADALQVLQNESQRLGEEPAFQVALGDVHRMAGDFVNATQAYETALKLNSQYAESYLGLGLLAAKQKNPTGALEQYEKAVAIKGSFPEVYEAIGLMWIGMGALPDAHTQLDAAEKMFFQNGVTPQRITQFYQSVIKALTTARGGATLAREWTGRQNRFRVGT